jgi:hypothetical protein
MLICIDSMGVELPAMDYTVLTQVKYDIVGRYELRDGNGVCIAKFTMGPLAGNAYILVSSGSETRHIYRNKGIGTLMNELRVEIARYVEAHVIMCTVSCQNDYQLAIMKKNGWEILKDKKRKEYFTSYICIKYI